MKIAHLLPLATALGALAAAAPAVAATASHLEAGIRPLIVAAPNLARVSVRDVGHAGAGARVDLAVILPYRNEETLRALVGAQSDLRSPFFGHYLTAAQFRDAFAPTPATYALTLAELQRAGFAVEASANRTVVHAWGTVPTAERYFRTRIDATQAPDGRRGYANVLPAAVPGTLGAAAVVGLYDAITVRTAASMRTAPSAKISAVGSPLFGPDGGFGPAGILVAEDFPVLHGYDGRGANVADLVDGAVTDSDVAAFLGAFNIRRTGPRTTTIQVGGGCGSIGCFDSFVATQDAEWILAAAPGASLFTYQLPILSDAAIALGFARIASDNAVNIVNIPFGACELHAGDLTLAIQPIVAQAVAQGIAFNAVAFGGANLCGVPQLALPMSPANLDTVTAVGGSNTFVDNSGVQQFESALSLSNGGVSLAIATPSYQLGVPGVKPSGRNVPDLVVPSSIDGTGPSVYYGGKWVGSSLFVNNAPISGYFASVQQMYGYRVPLGNVAPLLYRSLNLFGYGSGLFTDVTVGCIGGVNGAPVCARTGYDIASGIGSIRKGFALAKSFDLGPIVPPAAGVRR